MRATHSLYNRSVWAFLFFFIFFFFVVTMTSSLLVIPRLSYSASSGSALCVSVLLQTKCLFYLQVSFVMNTFHIQNQKKSRDDSDPSHASEALKTPLSIQLQIAFENAFSIVYAISLPPFAPPSAPLSLPHPDHSRCCHR
jgi:hypothetical protein